jgi:hypothetical protein
MGLDIFFYEIYQPVMLVLKLKSRPNVHFKAQFEKSLYTVFQKDGFCFEKFPNEAQSGHERGFWVVLSFLLLGILIT